MEHFQPRLHRSFREFQLRPLDEEQLIDELLPPRLHDPAVFAHLRLAAFHVLFEGRELALERILGKEGGVLQPHVDERIHSLLRLAMLLLEPLQFLLALLLLILLRHLEFLQRPVDESLREFRRADDIEDLRIEIFLADAMLLMADVLRLSL
ncbi:MAG: hypothetical protein PHE68_02600 [Candidatus Peribacteraceae bacterium]|nr:hypothetical protein [Candidatus Peribacteraceae bacterium]